MKQTFYVWYKILKSDYDAYSMVHSISYEQARNTLIESESKASYIRRYYYTEQEVSNFGWPKCWNDDKDIATKVFGR